MLAPGSGFPRQPNGRTPNSTACNQNAKQRGTDLVYRCGKGHAEPLESDKYSGELELTPLELIDRIAQLVPPPRTHRQRYCGVLAPNSPLRAAVNAMAQAEQMASPVARSAVADAACTDAGSAGGMLGVGTMLQTEPPAKPKPKPRPPSHHLWAALIARIYGVFPLICPMCGDQMRIIAFIAFNADIHKILEHIGVDAEAPRIAPARAPPLWDESGAQETGEGVEALPDWDLANQSPPDCSDDQRTTW
jgi:hypothetical protein